MNEEMRYEMNKKEGVMAEWKGKISPIAFERIAITVITRYDHKRLIVRCSRSAPLYGNFTALSKLQVLFISPIPEAIANFGIFSKIARRIAAALPKDCRSTARRLLEDCRHRIARATRTSFLAMKGCFNTRLKVIYGYDLCAGQLRTLRTSNSPTL